MSIAISALTIVASSRPKSEGTLRGCVNQSEKLRKIVYFKQMVFFSKTTIATLYTARNLFAFSCHNQILDLYYNKGTIVFGYLIIKSFLLVGLRLKGFLVLFGQNFC